MGQMPPRTRYRRTHFQRRTDPIEIGFIGVILLMVAIVVVTMLAASSRPAAAMNHGFDLSKPIPKWFEGLKRPDLPPNSCCSVADAYPVERYQRNPDHTLTIWVENGDAVLFPDGTRRAAWDVKVPISVPDTKVNPIEDQANNPTEHGWIFFRPAEGSTTQVGMVFCFVPQDRMN